MPGFTILELILSVFLTAIISPILTSHYIRPYLDFKKELIDTKRILQFHSNIFLNYFKMPIDEQFIQKVNDAQYDVRIKWSILSSTYYNIPKGIKLMLIHFKILPSKKDMDFIFSELIGISNSMVIYHEENSEIAIDDFEDRKTQIPKIIEILNEFL